MSKKILIILVVAIVVIVALGVWIGMRLSGSKTAGTPSAYSAVYLTTGDIYFGKYSTFPSPHMTNVWYIQRGTDAKNQPQVGIAPFTSVFWGPVDAIQLNEKNIVLVTKLSTDSQVVKTIQNPQSAAAPQGTGQPVPTPPAPTPSSTAPTPAR